MLKTRRLDWDSEFFGKEIAAIEAGDASDIEIHEAIENLKEFDLIYLFVSHPVQIEKFVNALVDKKRSYILEYPIAKASTAIIQQYSGHPSGLYELALQAGEHSRYRVDPYFKESDFIRLYKTWIDNSLTAGFADHVLVPLIEKQTDTDHAATKTHPLGFITAKNKGDELSIGLLATDADSRGFGIGSSLIQEIINIAARNNMKVEVTTQADNHKACHFYEGRGFHAASEEYVYHIYPKLIDNDYSKESEFTK